MNIFNRCLACCLIVTLVQDPVSLLASSKESKPNSANSTLAEDQRALHALNRLTFGPRPGDVEKVKAMGIDKWIELQLNPEKIDDHVLEARLADYPAMQLSQKDLMKKYPSQAMVRAIAAGREGMPHDSVEKAIYGNQVALFKERKAQAEKADAPGSAQAQPIAAADAQKTDGDAQMSDGQMMEQPAAPGGKGAKQNQATAAASTASSDDMLMAEDNGVMPGTAPSAAANEKRLYADLAATQIVNMPPDQRINKLVSLKPDEFRDLRKSLTNDERRQLMADLSPAQKEVVVALANPTALVAGELNQTRMLTDVYSERQLQVVMNDFWLNHFNVFLRKGPYAPWYLADYQKNVIAPRSMGKFEDLLVATAKSPAMLYYLDNFTSIGPHSEAVVRASMYARRFNAPQAQKAKDRGLNENYAREVMELHTLGVDGGYSQRDVTELAKVFTGWTINQPQKGGEFTFEERRHEPGTKIVLGNEIKEDGMKEGLKILHILATSPATAHFISKKLAVRFVSDDPPQALVDRMAATFLKTDGDIREVLRTMFTSPEFWSKDAYRAKVKTPQEFVISAVRASGGQVVQPQPLVQALNQLGMPYFGMQTPNGYSWKADAWVNTGDLLARINFSLALASNRMGTRTDFPSLMNVPDPASLSPTEKEAKLEALLLNGQTTAQTRATVLKQINDSSEAAFAGMPQGMNATEQKTGFDKQRQTRQPFEGVFAAPLPPPQDRQSAMIAGLLLGSPDFQRR